MVGKNKHFNPVLTQEKLGEAYDSIEFNLTSPQTDYDVGSNEAAAFVNLAYYTTINIRTNQNLTIKLNSTSNPAITVTSSRPFELDDLMKITNIYISNASGSTAAIKILGIQKGE